MSKKSSIKWLLFIVAAIIGIVISIAIDNMLLFLLSLMILSLSMLIIKMEKEDKWG